MITDATTKIASSKQCKRTKTTNLVGTLPTILAALLCIKRPHGGIGEEVAVALVEGYLEDIGVLFEKDTFGNLYVVIGTEYGESTTMFTCHLDTVHHADGTNPVHFDGQMITANGGECLGADDAAGAYLMLEMIKRNIPGTYIFHLAEEVGGLGSDFIVEHADEKWLNSFNRCISFDRKGTDNIITHQFNRCCSDVFADALGDQLAMVSDGSLIYISDDTGVFTDSANYVDYIPECTNLSVGYYNEHTSDEMQDFNHLSELLEALVLVSWEDLPTARDPDIVEHADYWKTAEDINASDQPHDQLTIIADLIKCYPREVAAILMFDGYDEYELDEKITAELGKP